MNLKVVIEQLSKLVDPGQTVVEITNIATLNDGDDFLLSKSVIVLSIVNIEEDKTLKNQSVYLRDTNDQTNISRYKQPTQHLIISVLFASYNKDMAKYLDGIDKLKNVISYFQQNNSFYYKIDDTEMIDYDTYLTKTELQKEQYQKITMESVSLTTEQLNQMWSCLGSKYMPSMLYKMRLCMIQQSPTIQEKVIKKVKVDLWENNQNDPVGLLESGEFDK
ncbi:Pvc16 family protein [Flavobacterium sp. GCM10027622]|uniref:Pvc16 family protein n=1 Tax=unclassified Flavobacterium TaxID=196869 RepID=UPI0036167C87